MIPDARDPQQAPPPRADYARTWRRYLRFFGPRGIADLDDELRFHVEMRVRDYMERGYTEAEARAATAQRLGDMAATRQTCITITTRRQRRMTRAHIIDALLQDLRFAGRTLRRQKSWTAVAALTLALGIGANSAMFSVVNHLLLNPISYPDADRIVVVFQEPNQGNTTGMRITVTPMGRTVAAWLSASRSFDDLEPYRTTDVTVERAGQRPRIAHTSSILPTFPRFAGQRPLIGRVFPAEEARTDAGVLRLSEGMWRNEFGGDPAIVGKSLTVNNRPYTVVGVMPGLFQLHRTTDGNTDLWMPLDLARADDDGLLLVGRLKTGVNRAAAAAELDSITARTSTEKGKPKYATKIVDPAEMISYRESLVLLSVAVGLVLLIACANVAHLLLARASTRQREMAIRAALGAGTERLFRQLLTESLLLSGAGCVGGVLVGWMGLRLMVRTPPESLADLAAARMDGTTILVTVALSVATGIAFGLIGAVQASRHSTHDALKAGAVSTSSGRRQGRLRGLLVITEMALCSMLLVGATLLLRSVMHLQTQDPGFEPRNLYSVELSLPDERYKTREAKFAFFHELTARVRALPGVESAMIASSAPPTSSFLLGALQVEGEPDPPLGKTGFLPYNGVMPDYFRLMRLKVLQGTTFTDTSEAAAQVIVNEGFAREHWPGQSSLGHKLRVVYNGQGNWMTVVGVVSNALVGGLLTNRDASMIYMPGTSWFRPTLIVRMSGDARILQTLASVVARLDSHLPPPQLTSIEAAMAKTIARPRFTMFLLLVFTVVAVGLAAIGLYGVLAYTVAQRTREIGIRIALGATRRRVARAVLSQGLALTLIGAALGLLAARGSVKLISSMLYGVQQSDFVAFAAGAVLLVVIALLACLVPVRRALAVDPLIAMRAD